MCCTGARMPRRWPPRSRPQVRRHCWPPAACRLPGPRARLPPSRGSDEPALLLSAGGIITAADLAAAAATIRTPVRCGGLALEAACNVGCLPAGSHSLTAGAVLQVAHLGPRLDCRPAPQQRRGGAGSLADTCRCGQLLPADAWSGGCCASCGRNPALASLGGGSAPTAACRLPAAAGGQRGPGPAPHRGGAEARLCAAHAPGWVGGALLGPGCCLLPAALCCRLAVANRGAAAIRPWHPHLQATRAPTHRTRM